jgi:hypothetical protein
MLSKLRKQLKEIGKKKHKDFDDFQPLIKKIAKAYDFLFPNFTENSKGSHYVYNFGIQGHFPFTIIKEHGGSEHQSPKTAKRAIEAIEDILDFIEVNVPDEQETASKGALGDEGDDDAEKATGTLSEPKIPDGSCGG